MRSVAFQVVWLVAGCGLPLAALLFFGDTPSVGVPALCIGAANMIGWAEGRLHKP